MEIANKDGADEKEIEKMVLYINAYPVLSFLLPSWRAVWSYRPHLEVRDPISGDDSLAAVFQVFPQS